MKIWQNSLKFGSGRTVLVVVAWLAASNPVVGLLSDAEGQGAPSSLLTEAGFNDIRPVNRKLVITKENAVKEVMNFLNNDNESHLGLQCVGNPIIGTPFYCTTSKFVKDQSVLIFLNEKNGMFEVLVSTKNQHAKLQNNLPPHRYEFAVKMTLNLAKDNDFTAQLTEFKGAINEKVTDLEKQTTKIEFKEICTTIGQILKKPEINFAVGDLDPIPWGNLCIWPLPNQASKKPAIVRVQVIDADYVRLSIQVGASHFSMKIPQILQDSDGSNLPWPDKLLKEVQAWQTTALAAKESERIMIAAAQEAILAEFKTADTNKCYDYTAVVTASPSFFANSPKFNDNQAACQMKNDETHQNLGNLYIAYIQYNYGLLNYGHLSMDTRAETVEYLLDLAKDTFQNSIKPEIADLFTDNLVTLGENKVLTQEDIAKNLDTCSAGCPPGQPLQQNAQNPQIPPIVISCKKGAAELITVSEVTEGGEQSVRIRFKYPGNLTKLAAMPTSGLPNQLILAKYNSYDQLGSITAACGKYKAFAETFTV